MNATPPPTPSPASAPIAPTPPAMPEPAPAALGACPNCQAPLYGAFCYACGQPKKGLIRHFGGVIGDFLDTIFNFDSRTFRTLPALYLRPGFLSNEYFAGRRVRYVTPLRLYFFLSIVAFLAIASVTKVDSPIEVRQAMQEGMTPEDHREMLEGIDAGLAAMPEGPAKVAQQRVRDEMAKIPIRAAEAEAGAERARAVQSAVERAKAEQELDAQLDEEFGNLRFGGGAPWHPKHNPLVLDWLSDDLNVALNEEIEVLIGKVKRIRKDPAPFVQELFENAPQALFVVLPLFALLLKLAYVFKRRLYMEHLIVALHSHSFLCLSLLLLIALSALGDVELTPVAAVADFLFALVWLWIPIYLLLMQKRVYRQGWIMTLLKYLVIGVLYVWLLALGLVLTMLVSLIFF